MLHCSICKHNISTFDRFIKHLKLTHAYRDAYPCASIMCGRTFSTLYSLKRHFFKNHSVHNIGQVERQDTSPIVYNTSENIEKQHTDNNIANDEQTFNIVDSNDNDNDINRSLCLRFVANLYCNNSVTRSLVQTIVSEVTEFVTEIGNDVLPGWKNLISKYNISDEDAMQFNNLLKNLKAPFNGLQTEYLRLKFFKESGYFFAPICHTICEYQGPKRIKGRVQHSIQKCTLQLMPLRQMFKAVLELPDTFITINNYIETCETDNAEYINNILQGKLWRNICKSRGEKCIFPFYIYFDEFETGNPLGSRAGYNKLGAVYASFACLPPQYSSQLQNIFLVQLYETRFKNMFTNTEVFKPLVNEISYLENTGVSVRLKSGTKQVYFCLIAVLGDNLGVNSILGFNEGFSSNFYCRICRLHKDECQLSVKEDIQFLRNPLNYSHDSHNLCYGVKSVSVFNDLKYFHNCVNFSLDFMHDIQEGICRYNMAHILNYFIFEKKVFTLATLNRRIEYFNHSSNLDAGNAPPPVKEDHIKQLCIIMSASEMFSFSMYFGCMMGDLVAEDDEVWLFYLIMFDLLVTLNSTSFNESLLSYLRQLILEHNTAFMQLFQTTLKPKYHLLLHYPTIITLLGPPRYYSSIRYEAFHRIFKTNARVVTSRVNIAYTLSIKCQLKLCQRLCSGRGFIRLFECSSKRLVKNVIEYSANNIALPACYKYDIAWCKINGVKYKQNQVLLVDGESLDTLCPCFGNIRFIAISKNNSVCFIVSLLNTLGYIRQFQSYLIERDGTDEFMCIRFEDLPSFLPNAIHIQTNGENLVSCVNVLPYL